MYKTSGSLIALKYLFRRFGPIYIVTYIKSKPVLLQLFDICIISSSILIDIKQKSTHNGWKYYIIEKETDDSMPNETHIKLRKKRAQITQKEEKSVHW